MKTIISILLAALLLIAPASALSTEAIDSADTVKVLPGGWNTPDSIEITDEIEALVQRAMESRIGIRVIPVALIGTQLVAGRNYAIFCRLAPVAPNAAETFAIVCIYEDLNGNASVTEIEQFEAETHMSQSAMMGGWKQAESAELTDETRAIFQKAADTLLGVRYSPVALISTQVVNGTNYCFLSVSALVSPNAEPTLTLVFVHAATDGSVCVTEVQNLVSAEIG